MNGDGRAGAALEQLVRARVERCNEGDWVDRRLVAEWHEVGILSLVAPLVDDEPAAQAQAAAPRR
jgi:hypothetical protein